MLAGVTGATVAPLTFPKTTCPVRPTPEREAFMAEAHWSLRPPREQASSLEPRPVNPKAEERLARTIQEKVAQGYRIESQTDTRAVLVKPPRRWLGITTPGPAMREVISIDRRGYPTVQTP